MDTWIVTGATGLLGSNIADALKNKFRLVGISRTKPARGLFDAHHAIDVRDDRSVQHVLETESATGIIHTAALANHDACTADPELATVLNTHVPGQLACLAHERDARFIHISTDAVFSGREGHYTETDLPQPFSLYGETKLAGERAVAQANPDALIVRTNFFGWSPSGDRSILEFFVTSLRRGQRVYGFPNYKVSSIYTRDLIDALEVVGMKGKHSGILHIGASGDLSKLDFGRLVAQHFEMPQSLISVFGSDDAANLSQEGPDLNLSMNVGLLTRLLGGAPPSTESGIQRAHLDESSVREIFNRGNNHGFIDDAT